MAVTCVSSSNLGVTARPSCRTKTIARAVGTYLPQVLRAARGSGLTPQQADEVTQETFKTFIEAADRFEGRSHVRTWLFGILYRKVAEERRNLARDRRNEPIDELFESQFDADGGWLTPPRRPVAGP